MHEFVQISRENMMIQSFMPVFEVIPAHIAAVFRQHHGNRHS